MMRHANHNNSIYQIINKGKMINIGCDELVFSIFAKCFLCFGKKG